eukprot:CAMPEP_0119022534 /NCGR_PEP_ID=MMETSP1176-20130426/28242_1 /TAXON_ID=265551 /ORGANISM="Synedropsis recta cf, Strain CCMP1620" /LENGTH=56 /DNA_ID=CAMNT_0006977425 /DNA_START=50 /DNA_END=220 /DNA_ORIENTATION=-
MHQELLVLSGRELEFDNVFVTRQLFEKGDFLLSSPRHGFVVTNELERDNRRKMIGG